MGFVRCLQAEFTYGLSQMPAGCVGMGFVRCLQDKLAYCCYEVVNSTSILLIISFIWKKGKKILAIDKDFCDRRENLTIPVK